MLAAPATQISPLMGSNIIIIVFAVVVIGGMGSILGSIITGLESWRDRGLDQGLLSSRVEHRRFRDHGSGSADSPRWTLREGR